MKKLLSKVLYGVISVPFRIKCRRIGKSFVIGRGYSFIGCNLQNVTIGDNVRMDNGAWISTYPMNKRSTPIVFIADNVNIGKNVTIAAAKKITIGKNCLISYNVSIIDHNHAFEKVNVPPLFQGLTEPETIEIGEECFIGAHSFILKGVSLGKHCVVGANSVVTSSFPSFTVVTGSPARKIRSLK